MVKASSFVVDTRPTKDVVVDGITRDATDEECIFDLLDNSIDAARNAIYEHRAPKHRGELVDNFSGFEINIHLSGDRFIIHDNCGGISAEHLKNVALRFGERSEQNMGIGAFGVGLNRALLRLGRISTITTDTGKERSEVVLNKDEYLRNTKNWDLIARRFQSTGKAETRIEIVELATETARNFGTQAYERRIIEELGRRYGRFIQKRLVVRVNYTPIRNGEVQLRENGPHQTQQKFYKTENGVAIYVEYGQHKLHRFPGESEHLEEQNRRLTNQYGWTILCNDRAIIISDRGEKTGWDITKFHSDFYGFVGNVNFVSTHPERLPWKTTKTDVDLNNPAYQLALRDMRHFAEEWRSAAGRRAKARAKGEAPKSPPPRKAAGSSARPSATKKTKEKKTTVPKQQPQRADHQQYREVLPADILEMHCFDKHLVLVREAKRIDMFDNAYAGLALTRMLLETSTVKYLDRHDQLDALKQFAIDERRKRGLEVTEEREKNAIASLDEMLVYFEKFPGIWGTGKQAYMRQLVGKLSSHKKLMNSALHHPLQPIHYTKAIEIRDAALPILRHLIEK